MLTDVDANLNWKTKVYTSQNENVKMTLFFADEGMSGDYDIEDAQDVPLLRLDVDIRRNTGLKGETVDAEWISPDKNSVCTLIDARAKDSRIYARLNWAVSSLSESLSGRGTLDARGVFKENLAQISYMQE